MRKESTRRAPESRVHYENLEEWVRGQVQRLIQELLEEITEFLGRARSARRSALDRHPGYRNGYGKRRRLTLGSGKVEVHRPRVRNNRGAIREPSAPPLRATDQQGPRADP